MTLKWKVIVGCRRGNSVLCSVDPDPVLFDLAAEVGVSWKELAIDVGSSDMIDVIEREAPARTPKEQAFKMLRKLHAKMGHSVFNFDDIRARIRKITKKQYDAQLKSETGDVLSSLFDMKMSLC